MRLHSCTTNLWSFISRFFLSRISLTSSASVRIWSSLRFLQFWAATLFLPLLRMSLIKLSCVSLRSNLDSLSLNSSIGRLMMSSTEMGTLRALALFSSLVKCSSSDFLPLDLSLETGLCTAPLLSAGRWYVWLCWMWSMEFLFRWCWRPNSMEHEYFISDGLGPTPPSGTLLLGALYEDTSRYSYLTEWWDECGVEDVAPCSWK